MITVEGLAGKGCVWCSVMEPLPRVVLPPETGLSSGVHFITALPPFECYLPPAIGNVGVLYDCELTPYGPRLTEIEIGAINSIDGDRHRPNPCKHTTMKGNLLYHGPHHANSPYWRIPTSKTTGWYDHSGHAISCDTGRPASNVSVFARDRYGVLKPFTLTMQNKELWYTDWYSLTDFYGANSDSSIPRPAFGIKSDQWVQNKVTYNSNFNPDCWFQRYNVQHVSANVWREVWDFEFHSSLSYIPATPTGHDGLGYVVCSVTRVLEHKMTFISPITPTEYLGSFSTTEEVSYWGHHPKFPVATYYSGTASGQYNTVQKIAVREPGLSSGGVVDWTRCNDYCNVAVTRAGQLFQANTMKSARTNCVADVSGLSSNWIENLSQVKGSASVFTPLLQGYKAVKKGDLRAAKDALAGAYLAYSYIVAPSIRDYHDVKDNAGNVFNSATKYRFSNERRRGMAFSTCQVVGVMAELSYFVTMHLQLKDDSLSEVWSALSRFGLDPSGGRAWDLIPFSFVADWFISIGPALKRISNYNELCVTRTVKSRIQTFAVKWPINESEFEALGLGYFSPYPSLNYSWYDRRTLTGVGSIDPFAGQNNDGLSASQTTQGLALLTSFI